MIFWSTYFSTRHQLFTNPSPNFSRPACTGTSCRLRNTPSILVQNGITEIFAHDFGARIGERLVNGWTGQPFTRFYLVLSVLCGVVYGKQKKMAV